MISCYLNDTGDLYYEFGTQTFGSVITFEREDEDSEVEVYVSGLDEEEYVIGVMEQSLTNEL